MKSVLLLSVMIIFDTCSAEDLVEPKFGCKFDSDYNLPVPEPDVDAQVHIQVVPPRLTEIQYLVRTRLGQGNVAVAKFDDEQQFNDFMDALEKVNAEVVQGTQYNTIDNLITFYDDYKKIDKGDSDRALYLNDLFVQYKEPYTTTDGASLTFKMVNTMITTHPQFARKMLASSLSTCLAGEFGNLTDKQFKVEPHMLPVKNYNDRVMGFMRIKIGKDKMGYIVMDPAHALMDIIVIMDSEKKVSKGITRDPTKNIIFLHEYQRRGDYIDVSSSEKSSFRDSKRTLCYIGKTFCSYEDSSRLPGLVMPSHSMVVHDKNWNVQGGLFLDLYETDDQRLVLWGVDSHGDPTFLNVENIKELYEQLEVKLKKVYDVGKALGKTSDQMDELLTKIGAMLDDDVFMFQMKRLYGWLSKDAAKY